jgi:hypothetical protein
LGKRKGRAYFPARPLVGMKNEKNEMSIFSHFFPIVSSVLFAAVIMCSRRVTRRCKAGGVKRGKFARGILVMSMHALKRRWKSRRGNKYPTKVIFIASTVCWIVALIFWYCVQYSPVIGITE